MKIQRVSAPNETPAVLPRRNLLIGVEDQASPVTVQIVNNFNFAPSADKADTKTGLMLDPLLVAGGRAVAVGGAGYWLATGIDKASAKDLAGQLQHIHYFADPTRAQDTASSLLSMLQSKGGNAILFGGTAGLATVVMIEKARPEWPPAVKWTLGLLAFALVAGFLYWGTDGKLTAPAAKPAAEAPHKPG